MSSSYSPVNEIQDQRQALKRQKQLEKMQGVWRSMLTLSFATGLIWSSFQPQWTINQLEQVEIQGNEYLSAEALQNIVKETTQQSILTLSPDRIEEILQNQAPIAEVTVSRDLYPPKVTIAIEERDPVALTIPNAAAINPLEEGYLDEKGNWMSKENYQSSETFPTVTLKVIGYRPQYRLQWAQIYPQLQDHPLEITTVNWQNPANLILETEIGEVHLGGNLESLPKQLEVLAQFPTPLETTSGESIDHINLKNPDYILIEKPSEIKN